MLLHRHQACESQHINKEQKGLIFITIQYHQAKRQQSLWVFDWPFHASWSLQDFGVAVSLKELAFLFAVDPFYPLYIEFTGSSLLNINNVIIFS
jgi:hypothetical protein